jgi:hypothetical protein
VRVIEVAPSIHKWPKLLQFLYVTDVGMGVIVKI